MRKIGYKVFVFMTHSFGMSDHQHREALGAWVTEVKILGICYFAAKADLAAIPTSGDPQDSHTA